MQTFETFYQKMLYKTVSLPVYGTEVRVFDEHLCEAIEALSERQRNIVLMSYFLEMSDIEIGEIIGISRCSVYRNRMRALNIIREKYTED